MRFREVLLRMSPRKPGESTHHKFAQKLEICTAVRRPLGQGGARPEVVLANILSHVPTTLYSKILLGCCASALKITLPSAHSDKLSMPRMAVGRFCAYETFARWPHNGTTAPKTLARSFSPMKVALSWSSFKMFQESSIEDAKLKAR